jgi:hypothetical protein
MGTARIARQRTGCEPTREAGMSLISLNVRSQGQPGPHLLAVSFSQFDRPCVKTHTSAKCRKHNSPARHRTSRVQYDLSLRDAIARRYFYVWRDRWSFRTAKTHSGPHPRRRAVNTEPLPGSLFTVASPPFMRVSLRMMARPSPAPP